MADKIAGKVTPTNEGEWVTGVKYKHPCFVMHDNTMYYSLQDNINREPGISADDWSYFLKEGGGGGGNTGVQFSVRNTSGWNSRSVTLNTPVVIDVQWSSIENDDPTGNGVMTLLVNNVQKARRDVAQGNISLDISNYIALGTNNVVIKITDSYGNSRNVVVTVDVVSLSIESTFDASLMQDGDIVYSYTPFGTAEKIVYFYLDNTLLTTVETTASNRQLTQIIPALSYGSHKLKVYFEADLDGVTASSNILEYDIISTAGTGTVPIVTINFDKSSIRQYENAVISYQVYDPNSLTAEATISVNGTVVSDQVVDRTRHEYSYRAFETGSVTMTVACGSTSKSITFDVQDSGIDVEAETVGLSLYLSAQGHTNNDANRSQWVDTTNNITANLTGFNWVSNGWMKEDDGTTYLHVSNGARVEIPYYIFGNDFRANGKTIELEFSSSDVMNYDTIIATCMSGGRGIEITPQFITMKSEQSSMTMQYKESEHVRISFVVETNKMESSLIHCYVDGIDSCVKQYPTGDNFQQVNPVSFVFGSDYSAINLYSIRVYDIGLTSKQIVENWIADTQNVDDLIDRYNRNNIYDAYGEISLQKLPSYVPYMVVKIHDYMDLPQYKGDKKYISGYFVYHDHPELNFTFENAQFNVQGTSSQYYARKNYKAGWKKGPQTKDDGSPRLDENGNPIVSSTILADGSSVKAVPINGGIAAKTWCLKADVASSEGTNNVELVRLYNDICPYKNPAQIENPKVRLGIDGFPALLFWEDDSGNTHFVGRHCSTCPR